MTSRDRTSFDLARLFLCVLGFLLLWEWLRPIEQLTDTANIEIFIVYVILSLTLSYFNIRAVFGIPIKLLYILLSMHYLYFEGSFFSFKWFLVFMRDLSINIGLVFQPDWNSLSDLFRSLLFFILLWLMTYLIRYWLINRRQILFFFLMTLMYITVLDTFTPYEADYAIVRTVIVGFAVMGILTFYRILEKEKIDKEASISKSWIFPLVVMIGVSVVVGYTAPKSEPIWPDPVPFIKSYSNDSGGGGGQGVNKVGYGTDDSRLGGPFVGDDTVVYEANVSTTHYWKVETKDVYTGKGWIAAREGGIRRSFSQEDQVPFSNYVNGEVEVEEKGDIVRALVPYPHVIYPVGVKSILAKPDYSFEADEGLEKIYVAQGSKPLEDYRVIYDSPKYSVKAMMETVDANHPLLNDAFIVQYTQLPEDLPQRVKDLALEITDGEETWFDKARAVEKYLNGPEFVYDQTDVEVPEENQDYVDQFLFDTKRGYCDNFSTSMVVLIRSLGIPTRWVKGYTEGELKDTIGSGEKIYQITNNNAHSWVEVMLPEVGWVPFEPTKGFSNNVQFNFDNFSNERSNVETLAPEKDTEVEKPNEEKDTKESTTSSFSIEKAWDGVKKFFVKYWERLVIAALLVGLITFLLFKTRIKWLPYYLLFRFKRNKRKDQFPNAYIALLKHLDRYGLKRKPDQTLRDYAKYIDHFFSSKEMGVLTSHYERYLYKGSLQEESWEETKELWENLIKKTIA